MKQKSIAILKRLFELGEVNEKHIKQLKTDERIGVQKLIRTYEKKQEKHAMLGQKFLAMCHMEQRNYAEGCEYIAGVDEAGRGPLAGPVVAAAVILPKNFRLLGLTDSKQISETLRNNFFQIIVDQAISYGISVISNEKIDEINIFEATKRAMYNSLEKLDPQPDHALLDAVQLKHLPFTSEAIIKGDQQSISIAAASVLAKVTRDRLMRELHNEHPVYNFHSNMGYGTKHHLKMLKKYGVSPHHRRSYEPVRNVMNR